VGDGELAEGERERLTQLAARFSREDLMRAFDLLANAEQEIRTASHPRYQFEMLLLKWMHTRKLVPLTELLGGGGGSTSKAQIPNPKPQIPSKTVASAVPVATATMPVKAAPASNPEPRQPAEAGTAKAGIPNPDSGNLKDKFLAEIRSGKQMLYNTVVAQAQRIDVTGDRITFVFGPAHSSLRGLLDQQKPWLDTAAERVAGRKIAVTSELSSLAPQAAPANPESRIPNPGEAPEKKRDLKAEAMSSSTVQAMLDVFPAEIRDVEEM
jgi:DNA polymerase-3 subunit gamma/tau